MEQSLLAPIDLESENIDVVFQEDSSHTNQSDYDRSLAHSEMEPMENRPNVRDHRKKRSKYLTDKLEIRQKAEHLVPFWPRPLMKSIRWCYDTIYGDFDENWKHGNIQIVTNLVGLIDEV